MTRKRLGWLASVTAVALITSCSSSTDTADSSPAPNASSAAPGADTSNGAESSAAPGSGAASSGAGSADAAPNPDIAGDITVLTNRTDLIDTDFADYKATFEGLYPNVTVTFEAITDYEKELPIRMSTEDYGDVLLIPNTVKQSQLPDFFTPLGTVDELKQKYRFVDEQAYEGQGYGIAITGNASGIVYNKTVLAAAEIDGLPTTPEEFLTDLQTIKDKTDAIPYYTNYKDGWPLSQWEGMLGTPTGDPDARNALGTTDAPWTAGQDQYFLDSLIFDIVNKGLSEDDPLTTNWENSKNLLATGKVASMTLGSWAIVQMQKAAVDAGGSAEDIGYLPFPHQVDGKFQSTISGDYKNAINIHSENQEAARAWIDWFADKSGYATTQGGVSPLIGGPDPETLADFVAADVQYIELTPAPAGTESLVNDITTETEIDLFGQNYRQKLVDIARGAADGTKESYFAELNTRWAEGRAEVG